MCQRILALAIAFVLVIVQAAGALDPPSLLQLDTWTFSQEDQDRLNAAHAVDLGPEIMTAIAKATGNLPIGTVRDFRADDLNADGICEIVAAVDVSGRGLVRDLITVSRNGGAYSCDTIPAYGGEIRLWGMDGKQMLVTMQPAYDLSRSDPLITYPRLFSWTGTKCEDVSQRTRPYYEDVFLPQIKSMMAEAEKVNVSTNIEDRHRIIIRVASLSHAAVKVNRFFDVPIVQKADIGAITEVLESLGASSRGNLDSQVAILLRNATTEAEAEQSRLAAMGD